MTPELRLVPPGIALIAVCYGLARFAYGLFLPEMRTDVGLDAATAGLIGGGAYIGYCASILVSAFLVERLGPRFTSAAAGSVAAIGMLLAALSTSPGMLAAAVLIAGTSTGLASPPMADAVARLIPPAGQPRANTLINSGTGIGVALAGPIALAATGHWRLAYFLFGIIAAAVTIWLLWTMPDRFLRLPASSAGSAAHPVARGLARRAAVPVLMAAAGMGFASAACWTFAAEVMVQIGRFPPEVPGLAWVTIGVAGLAGGMAGDLIRRYGINTVHRGALVSMALATIALVVVPPSLAGVLSAAAAFGATYITLTGVYLVWGVEVYDDRPAVGITLPFMMIAAGQAIGTPVAGFLIETVQHVVTFVAFAGAAVITTALSHRSRTRAPADGFDTRRQEPRIPSRRGV